MLFKVALLTFLFGDRTGKEQCAPRAPPALAWTPRVGSGQGGTRAHSSWACHLHTPGVVRSHVLLGKASSQSSQGVPPHRRMPPLKVGRQQRATSWE